MTAQRAFSRPPTVVTVARSQPVSGYLKVPGSKSQTNRAFVLASLGAGVSRVTGALVADDSFRMVQGLRGMGIAIEQLDGEGRDWLFTGCGGNLPDVGDITVDAGLAGTVMRFLSAIATLAPHETTITGQKPLLARPIGDLLSVLQSVGADIEGTGDGLGFPPVRVKHRRPRGGTAVIDASKSSQFASALLLAAPHFEEGLDLSLAGLAAPGYFKMTSEMMRSRGARLTHDGAQVVVDPGSFGAYDEGIAGDVSAASHLLTLAAATAGHVVIENLSGADLQPDIQILETFAAFGCAVDRRPDGSVGVTGPDRLTPVDVDLMHTPDQLPNVAVLAALARGQSVIRGVGITRFHETDRIAAVERELSKIGVQTEVRGDDVVVKGGSARPGAVLQSHHDHRLAMAFASLGAALGDVQIENADAVEKTYPTYWADVQKLGAAVAFVA